MEAGSAQGSQLLRGRNQLTAGPHGAPKQPRIRREGGRLREETGAGIPSFPTRKELCFCFYGPRERKVFLRRLQFVCRSAVARFK